ncbi:MAG: hypothetical protein QGG36_07870 [Pirellulaceae bacterium]|jgi:hypothetical protein|nr:hypothetical protein [Pirellulaceae bacterium]MDP7015701.1 hypothetical protein [Pirellulaceae bacterium]
MTSISMMRQLLFGSFCLVHLLGVAGAVTMASLEIRSILMTGPAFCLLAVAVAVGWLCCRSPALGLYGVSTIAISGIVFLSIICFGWGPGEAERPVVLMLLSYQFFAIPLGLLALSSVLVQTAASDRTPWWRFNLQSALVFSIWLGVSLATSKAASQSEYSAFTSTAIGLTSATVLGVGYVVILSVRGRVKGRGLVGSVGASE